MAAEPTTGGLPGFDQSRVHGAGRVLDDFVADGTLVGGVLGVTNRAGATWLHPFGSAGTAEHPEPTRADHRFLLTSVTKHFVTAQVLQLVEAGLVELEAPVATYLPEFAANGKERVTTLHLLTHTSGMNLTANTAEVSYSNLTAEQHLHNALDSYLSWEPGTWFEYNSPSYWLLAEMVTRLTGVHYAEHMLQRITGPLGLDDTRYETGDELPERYVPSWAGPRAELAESNRKLAYPSGGLISSAGDLLRFGCCLLNKGALDGARILCPRSVELLSRPYVPEVVYRGRKTAWGLGWQLGGPGDLRGERTLFQWGASGTAMWVDDEAGLSVVLLTATWLLDLRVYGQIVNAVYGCMTEAHA
jgi:CubicO group peptidase (beta-lactamase class C family)